MGIEEKVPTSLSQADLKPRGNVHPSPADWRDQVFYFLLPDRFSDGHEEGRAVYAPGLPLATKKGWMQAGKQFQGGTLAGIESKIPYLADLGVTALWIGPVWRQRSKEETYHGYAIQNFLDVDPRFGTRQDLRRLVDRAHEKGLYVILDVIYNHTGDNWFYDDDGSPCSSRLYRFEPPYGFHGWRAGNGETSLPRPADQEDGVWPEEFQDPKWYTRAGSIGQWDQAKWEEAMHPNNEFRRGDFYAMKDLRTNEAEPDRDVALSGAVLSALIGVYRYWIAVSDCDGFRLDTVKHVTWEASRNFCGGIREYAESLGKDNFLLLGEVTGGGAMARNYLDVFGRNLDCVLDIGEPATALSGFTKGQRSASDFFGGFGGHDDLGSHREVGRYHVSILDDHDMVSRFKKARYCSANTIPARYEQVAHAVGVQLTTLGMPCIYYGTEQAFDGSTDYHDYGIEPADDNGKIPYDDRYIREGMFGGSFGAFQTAGCHFFDPGHESYRRIAAIAAIRNRKDSVGLALRRGRQYQRDTSFFGGPFAPGGPGEIVAWSRILYDREVVMALNTHGTASRGAFVTVDAGLHKGQAGMQCLYHSGHFTQPPAAQAPAVPVQLMSGRSVVRIDLPPAGFTILA